jgi:hypothetical protein
MQIPNITQGRENKTPGLFLVYKQYFFERMLSQSLSNMRDSELLYLYDVQKQFAGDISLNPPIKLADVMNGNAVVRYPISAMGRVFLPACNFYETVRMFDDKTPCSD